MTSSYIVSTAQAAAGGGGARQWVCFVFTSFIFVLLLISMVKAIFKNITFFEDLSILDVVTVGFRNQML